MTLIELATSIAVALLAYLQHRKNEQLYQLIVSGAQLQQNQADILSSLSGEISREKRDRCHDIGAQLRHVDRLNAQHQKLAEQFSRDHLALHKKVHSLADEQNSRITDVDEKHEKLCTILEPWIMQAPKGK